MVQGVSIAERGSAGSHPTGVEPRTGNQLDPVLTGSGTEKAISATTSYAGSNERGSRRFQNCHADRRFQNRPEPPVSVLCWPPDPWCDP